MRIEELKNQILDKISDFEIDVTELNSYVESGLYCEESWDEEEEIQAQRELFADYIEEDGLVEYTDATDDEARKYTKEILKWLRFGV